MSASAAMWSPLLFGCALFLSSALLMMVQPMLGKTLLPHLGGNPVAWNACLVFFQATLLAGYVYADLLHRFRGLRWQPWLQLGLMAIAIFLCFAGVFGDRLLVNLAPRLDALDTSPIVGTISLLIVTIGMPFFLLAAIGPLVQRWFAHLDHLKASDPYFLFVASNLGGLMGLIVYTLMIEPGSPLNAQWISWKLAVTALGVLLFLTALCAWQSPRNPEMEPAEKPSDPNAPLVPRLIGRGPATWRRRWYWFIASAIPAGLLLAVTNYLTQDIASAPILWAVPLALYLTAFALEFARFSLFDRGPVALKVTLHLLYGFLFALFAIALLVALQERGGNESGMMTFSCGVLFLLTLMAPSVWLPVLQPLSALGLVFVHANMFLNNAVSLNSTAILMHLACYYWSVRLCLGMLAKDRPAAPALTTYYTWIGIGGLGGGLFTLVIAPWLFRSGYREYALLTALACTLAPAWFAHGLSDWLLCRALFSKRTVDPDTPNLWASRIPLAFDVGLAFMVGVAAFGLFFLRFNADGPLFFQGPIKDFRNRLSDIPLVIALVLTTALFVRPLRFGLALTTIVAICFVGQSTQDNVLMRDRSAFGTYRVTEDITRLKAPGRDVPPSFTERKLTQGAVIQGTCITDPQELSRYPTAYYHRAGPAGQVMRRLEWWRVDGGMPINQFNQDAGFWLRQHRDNVKGDARLVASLIGMGASPVGGSWMQTTAMQTTAAWSEPPFAIVGLGVGSMYCYARPFQWVDAYELDPAIIALSTQEPPMFHYYQSAQKRGVGAKIFPGDARRNLTKPGREGFYHVLFVDAFNSDAIPTHLLTQEAIELYFQKLTPEGVVCIHTSNRHVDLPSVLQRLTQQLNLSMRELHAKEPIRDTGMLSSQWVVLARDEPAMRKWSDAGGFGPQQGFGNRFGLGLLWTDEHSSVLSAVRTDAGWPRLIYGILIILLLFGIALGLIEITSSMIAPPVVKAAAKK
jgi:hypothetical protein